MKILLINPPRYNEILGNNPSIIEEERGINPPLGLLYLAGYLEKFSKYDVTVIDSQIEKLDYSGLASRVNSIKPDIAGITAMTLTMIDVIETIKVVKKINKEIRIVLGGPHVHLFPEETIRLKNIDYLVLGEGEKILKELLDRIDDKSELRKVPGLVFKDKENVINTGIPPTIKNLDEIPFPARDMVPYKKYNSLLTKGDIATTMMTSRGCPFKCSFCDRPHLGKVFRARSVNNVVDELEECVKLGIYDFLFYDDTFTLDKKRVVEICEKIIERKLDIAWDIRTRVDFVDGEVLKYLKKAGCQGIHYGIEAGTERILKILNKGITINQAKHIFDLTRKYKIPILAYFMIGNPTETIDEIYTTFKVMKELKPDYAHITIFTPFPGTKSYVNGIKNGVIRKDYWQEFAENPTPDFVPPLGNEYFDRAALDHLLIEGYHEFYLRPSYMFKRLVGIRNINELKKKAKAGIKVLRMK